MSSRSPLPDDRARRRIISDLSSTLFVEAGAGSGKTKALVDRVLALVKTGAAEVQSIAAVTFTEKAGAELRDRIRRELKRSAGEDADPETQARCRAALEQVDAAAIGTLHSFAQRLLNEHPVEAGLPPRLEVLDEVSSEVAFEQRWSRFQDALLSDPDLERTILLLLSSGIRPAALRSLAQAFDDNWDLVEERVSVSESEPPPVSELLVPALSVIAVVCNEPCRNPQDKLRLRLDDLARFAGRLASLSNEFQILDAIGPNAAPKPPSFKVGNVGQKAAFDCDLAELRGRVAAAGEQLEAVRTAVSTACARRLGSAIRQFTLSAAAERQQAGRLEFHDLLVLARALLRSSQHGPAVRMRLHEHYQRILLDEFQDTDPIQIELAVRIASAHSAGDVAGLAQWSEVPVVPGHLFIVGDPKQSIYRFRRADISTFLAAAARFGAEAGGAVELTSNFRTARSAIAWVNQTFATLMSEPDDIELPRPSQPQYIALDATRPDPAVGPVVSVLGRAVHPKDVKADDLRGLEAAEVASAVLRILHEGWTVDDSEGSWRAAELGDITILVPARTSLPFLEDALDGAGIPFRAEASSLVYGSRAVRDLLMVIRAVADPTNHLHIVSALRTPLLGCGDDDLFRFKVERKGHWGYRADQPNSVPTDEPVHVGLKSLRSLHEQQQWLTPSELFDLVARDRRAFELGFTQGRPRDVWRRLRFVIDQARGWSEATNGNLRQYLAWVALQTSEGARVAEAILPETDDDAVRIMTIHSAKGLEFPITIVSGMSTAPRGRAAPAEVVFPPTGDVGYRFGKHVQTDVFEEWKPIDEQMGLHERIRLLYVACTRARDHLVVSLHRKERTGDPKSAARTNAELLVAGMGDRLDHLPDAVGLAADLSPLAPELPSPLPPFEEWQSEWRSALNLASRPNTIAATALTDEGTHDSDEGPDPGLQKRPRDLDLPPWLKGRYGTAVGRAVHGVLQTVDLASRELLAEAVAAQCEAEAVPDRADQVLRLATAALESPSVRAACASRYWREVYACTPIEGRLLEGYIDLLYRDSDGLVVVDYKTAGTSDPAELDRRLEGYRNQGASYALVMGASTGEPVARVTFLFLTPDGAIERHLSNLDDAVAEVRRLVAVGAEIVTA